MKRGLDGGDLAGLGGMIAAAFIAPMLIGLGIDSVARSGPLFFLIGLAVGIVGAIVTGYTRFKRFL
jgi:hypothetical protein